MAIILLKCNYSLNWNIVSFTHGMVELMDSCWLRYTHHLNDEYEQWNKLQPSLHIMACSNATGYMISMGNHYLRLLA